MSESAANRLLPRTWMLSKHRYDPRQLGNDVIHVHETPPHALSHANTTATDEQLEQERREREARAKFDALAPIDVEILRLSLERLAVRDIEMPFPAAQRRAREDGGWNFVRYRGAGNRFAIMAKSCIGQWTHREIAVRVGLSVWQVRRRLSALDPLLVKYAEMRGWI